MLLLLLLAITPTQYDIQGLSGENVQIEMKTFGDAEPTFRAAPPLTIEQVEKEGMITTIVAKINPSTKPGIYDTFVYAIPKSKQPVVAAAGMKINLEVKQADATKMIEGSAVKNHWPAIIISTITAAMLGMLGYHRKKLLAFIQR